MEIFILAGGFGTRLRSVVHDVPKPMAPIYNRPFLDYQLEHIRQYFPTTRVYLLTYYMSEIIEEYYECDDLVSVIKEPEPLGTGGSITHAIEVLNLDKESELLILNGDTFIQPNLQQFIEVKQANISILSSFQTECSRYGTLEIQDKQIMSFNEKVQGCENSYINAGCYYFKNLSFFKHSFPKAFALEDAFKEYLRNYGKISTFKYNDIFIDIGIPEDYEKMKNYIGNRESE